jgi:hypothetical protein
VKRWASLAVIVGLIAGVAVLATEATVADATPATASGVQPVIAVSDHTTCAIRESYRVYCWGVNGSGELGRNNTSANASVLPVASTLTDAMAVYGANVYRGEGGRFCAIKLDRTVAC